MTNRVELINWLIKSQGYSSYLEIGVSIGRTFNQINAEHKTSVDPNFPATYEMTSDEYFAEHATNFDIIFIDGLHSCAQVELDINKALFWLKLGGTIVCHDINPPDEYHIREGKMCWSAWQAWAHLRSTRSDLYMAALTFDFLGVIRRGEQQLWTKPVIPTWDYLSKYKHGLLNIITTEQLKQDLQ